MANQHRPPIGKSDLDRLLNLHGPVKITTVRDKDGNKLPEPIIRVVPAHKEENAQ